LPYRVSTRRPDTSGANQTDDSYLLFIVAPAQAGAQGLRRSVGCPWVPAFAGMTEERTGTRFAPPGLALLGLMVRGQPHDGAVTDTEAADNLAVPLAIPIAIDVRHGDRRMDADNVIILLTRIGVAI
jgi:hypothetical protein